MIWPSLKLFVFGLGRLAAGQTVFAHVLVGNCQGWSAAQWRSDIALAQTATIDGFVLNVATPYSIVNSSIANAFQAAHELEFKLVFSFDYLGGVGAWSSIEIVNILEQYVEEIAYFRYQGRPLVSTFEGVENIEDWNTIRSRIHTGIFLIPAWTSLGPDRFGQHLDTVDGAFSWEMWPIGASDITTDSDVIWKSMLGSKLFMMGVSPWFFANLPRWNKAWLWRGDDMWHQRWQQVAEVKPEFVQIVTWNDFGESHYIGPIHPDGIPQGADSYVNGMPHEAWMSTLPYYIAQYKSGGKPNFNVEVLQYWYRLTPAAAGSSGAVTGNAPYQPAVDPNSIVQDKVFVTAIVSVIPSRVSIRIGQSEVAGSEVTTAGIHHFSADFEGQTGVVTIQLYQNGIAILASEGPAIMAYPPNGVTNYNPWVGSVRTGRSDNSSSETNQSSVVCHPASKVPRSSLI